MWFPRSSYPAVLAVLALVVCGCSGDVDPKVDPPLSSAPSTAAVSPSPETSAPVGAENEPTPAPTSDPEEAVEAVVLRPSDVEFGAVEPFPSGDQVEGQVTLDMCGYVFTSEAARVARRQVGVRLTDPDVLLSNEVVAYADEEAALGAMGEFVESLSRCQPGRPVASATYVGDVTYGKPELEVSPDEYPLRSSIEVTQTITVRGSTLFAVLGFQQWGRIVDANYLVTPEPATQEQLRQLHQISTRTGRRLQALPR